MKRMRLMLQYFQVRKKLYMKRNNSVQQAKILSQCHSRQIVATRYMYHSSIIQHKSFVE